jgi:putative oxidoreductase
MGMKWPKWQARAAAATEIGAGVMLAVGLLTPLAAAGVIGVMVVAIYTSHLKVGFFVFLTNQGWEYCATIALGALAVGTMGPGEWSVDNAIDFSLSGWGASIVTLALGVGGAAVHLATSYRPVKKS